MKKSLLLSAFLISVNSFAAQINFNGTLVSVTEVCYLKAEDSFRTTKPVTIYQWIGDEHKAIGKEYLTTSRTYYKYYGSDEGAEVRELKYALTYELYENDDIDSSFNNSKKIKYQIETCSK